MPVVSPIQTSAEKLSQIFEAAELISALQVIALNSSSQARLGDPTGTFEDAKAVGIALSAGNIGAEIEVQTFGVLNDPFFNFPVNAPLFLSSGGAVTDVAPVSGFGVQIGHSLGLGSIFINVGEPIQLI